MRGLKFIFLLFPFLLFSQTPAELFQQGNAAYNGGNYALAIEKYELILAENVNSDALYFNLGNAHYRLGNAAESVYYFEQAKRLAPGDKAIQNNAAFAGNMTLDAIENLPQTQIEQLQSGLLQSFSLDQWAYISLSLAWLTLLFFLVYRLSKGMLPKRVFFVLGSLFLLSTFLSLGLSQQKSALANQEYGVIFAKEIEIWGEPNKRAEILFLLHEGTKLEVVDALEGWSKIRIANGSEGWIENSAFKSLN